MDRSVSAAVSHVCNGTDDQVMDGWPGFVRAGCVSVMQKTDKQRKGIILTVALIALFVLFVFVTTFFKSM